MSGEKSMETAPESLRAAWEREEKAPLDGWDFSRLDGRYEQEPLPWDYRKKVTDFLKPQSNILDMGTGGGEFLLSLRHPFELTSVTEAWPPNLELCRKRLSPLGITVREAKKGGELPFGDDTFDIVLNRHEEYNLEEVFRVLKPGGFFITQQVGGKNNFTLSKSLLPAYRSAMPDFNLENELPRFKAAGFRIMYSNQSYPWARFTDVGAVCFLARAVPWEFPGFSVESCFDRLCGLQRQTELRGFVESTEHRFIIIGKKQRRGDSD